MNNMLIQLRNVGTASVVLALLCLFVGSCTADDANSDSGALKWSPLAFSITTDELGDGTTRGTPSEDLEESIGIYAYTYAEGDAWDNGNGTAPNFMINEEMQNAGTFWTTVNAFDLERMRGDDTDNPNLYMRFFAYYPYGLPAETMSVTDGTHDNAPQLTYTVPAEVENQKDLLAGGCIDDEGHTKVFETEKQITANTDHSVAEDVTVHMHHLLTAISFQVGECKEAGRIKSITLTNILGRNTYSLHRDADDLEFVGWEVRNWGDDYDEDFRDFTIDLNKQIKLTQMNGDDVVMQPVTDNTQWLLMIPQALSEETELQVVYNCGGSDHTLTYSNMEGFQWLEGKRIIYTLNINSLQRLTVKSTVVPWGTGLNFQDGQPTNATNIDVTSDVTDWNTTEQNIASDDPRD